jgi:hypothetical protein
VTLSASWIPLLRSKNGDCQFGIVGSEWAAMRPSGDLVRNSERPGVFLSLLELSIDSLRSAIDDACNSCRVPEEQCPPFPFVQMAQAGLRSESSYWQGLALQRITELPDVSPLVEDLATLASSGLTQSIRHKAKKILRNAKMQPTPHLSLRSGKLRR